jgi:hypothetical protein
VAALEEYRMQHSGARVYGRPLKMKATFYWANNNDSGLLSLEKNADMLANNTPNLKKENDDKDKNVANQIRSLTIALKAVRAIWDF